MQDIERLLSLEIKKEIADRYFGFRKTIEEDIQNYDEQLNDSLRTMEMTIGLTLIRVYLVLNQRPLIEEFHQLTGLSEDLFFDPYLLESSAIRKRVLFSLPRSYIKGFTKRQKFIQLLFSLYHALRHEIDNYRQSLESLIEEQETIAEEIKYFYRNNDLSTIMGFLRNLDHDSSIHDANMAGEIMAGRDQQFEDKMLIQPPRETQQTLPVIPAIKPLQAVKHALKHLAIQAFEQQGQPDARQLFLQN